MDNPELSVNILEEKLRINTFDVPEQNVVRVFERLDEAARINAALFAGGVGVQESYLAGQDLEGYFMELLGGRS